ncbi:unnamed protein product, partial [marine sediment metagenome]
MTVPYVPLLDPAQGEIVFPDLLTPYSSLWWNTYNISGIPNDAVGWMVAQGWQITDVAYDNAPNPPVPYYALSKTALQNEAILQSLLNSYTVAYNDARWAN